MMSFSAGPIYLYSYSEMYGLHILFIHFVFCFGHCVLHSTPRYKSIVSHQHIQNIPILYSRPVSLPTGAFQLLSIVTPRRVMLAVQSPVYNASVRY